MKIIDRYIGISVIATAFFGVVVLSLVLVLVSAGLLFLLRRQWFPVR